MEDKYIKNRWILLFVVVMAPLMATIDSSIVNVALPTMAGNLKVDIEAITWVVTIYLIVISSIVLIFGRIGDMISKSIVFNIGFIIFSIGSLLCGLSHSFSFLIFSRIIQGIGAAATMASNQGIIVQIFPQNERGRALGINATFVAFGTLIGPPLGGMILSVTSWEYIFLINVPIGIIASILTFKLMPRFKNTKSEKMDIKGSILFPVAIMLLFYSLSMLEQLGSNLIIILLGISISVLLIIVFVLIERKIAKPLLDVNIFKNSLYSLSVFCSFLSYVALSCINIIQPFYLQDVLKLSAGKTGIFMMIYPLVLAIAAPLSGYLSDKIGSEFLTFLGLCLTAAGLLFMSFLKENSSLYIVAIFISFLGIGNGLFQSPNNSLVMSTVPRDKLGIAGSINALIRNIGLTFGIILSTTILYNSMSMKIGYNVFDYVEGRDDVFVYGMHIVYLSFSMICLIGAVLTAIRLINNRKNNKS
ncbi:MAG: MFS transporter [Oscillospiraceae bacterium]|nr:MFS transporter [Oscillospiraceae bacterium]